MRKRKRDMRKRAREGGCVCARARWH
jgi:hypothetical protein